MEKVYKAKSHLSINVIMPNGKSRHVTFNSLTGGGSIYSTSDEAMQGALECHHNYGLLFKLDKIVDEKTSKQADKASEVVAPAPKVKVMKMASLDDAKAYLADNFGISRTKLRSKKQIEDAGAANGIEFSFE